MNVLNKDERFYLFLLEICKRARTRQSAFYGFNNTDLFFYFCLFVLQRSLGALFFITLTAGATAAPGEFDRGWGCLKVCSCPPPSPFLSSPRLSFPLLSCSFLFSPILSSLLFSSPLLSSHLLSSPLLSFPLPLLFSPLLSSSALSSLVPLPLPLPLSLPLPLPLPFL